MTNEEKIIELRRAFRFMLLLLLQDEPEVKELFSEEELLALEDDLKTCYDDKSGTMETYLRMILGL